MAFDADRLASLGTDLGADVDRSDRHTVHVNRATLREFLDIVRDLVADSPPHHVLDLEESGWFLHHPLSCRPDIPNCPLVPVVSSAITEPREFGRFRVDLTDESGDWRLVVERIDWPGG